MALKKQLSVTVVNQAGEGAKLCSLLGEAGIGIEAVSVCEFTEGCVIRLVTTQDRKAMELLRDKGYGVLRRVVVSVVVDDTPGALGKTMALIAEKGHNVNYCYGSAVKGYGKATIVFAVDDPVKVDLLLAEGD